MRKRSAKYVALKDITKYQSEFYKNYSRKEYISNVVKPNYFVNNKEITFLNKLLGIHLINKYKNV